MIAELEIPQECTFGSLDLPHELSMIPPSSNGYYDVELLSFVTKKESWDMQIEEKVEEADKMKEEGNALFKAGKHEGASNRYEKAARFIGCGTSFGEKEKAVQRTECDLQLE